jgi:hypothetical protein
MAVFPFVAVDHQAVERRAGRAADERNLKDVRLAVVASGFFEVHRTKEHVGGEIAGEEAAGLQCLDLAPSRVAVAGAR